MHVNEIRQVESIQAEIRKAGDIIDCLRDNKWKRVHIMIQFCLDGQQHEIIAREIQPEIKQSIIDVYMGLKQRSIDALDSFDIEHDYT